VFAVGDVVAATPQLAHVGFAEGIVIVKTILGEPVVRWTTDGCRGPFYCTRGGLRRPHRGGGASRRVRRGGRRTPSAAIAGPGSSGTPRLVKVIAEQRADGTTGRILGVHMAGPWVTEQLGAGYLR